jgi:hypothetical protein|tara:strand:- start:8856 stop:9263 length:408 start_codon:yes stop_codon:yes gene_type:complete
MPINNTFSAELLKDRAIKNNIDAKTLLVQLHDDHEFVAKVLRPVQKQIIRDYKNNKYDREKGIEAHIRVFDALQQKYNPKPTNPSSFYDEMYMYMPMTKRAAARAFMNQFERIQNIKLKRDMARRGLKRSFKARR